jgi:hypothetical protein
VTTLRHVGRPKGKLQYLIALQTTQLRRHRLRLAVDGSGRHRERRLQRQRLRSGFLTPFGPCDANFTITGPAMPSPARRDWNDVRRGTGGYYGNGAPRAVA